jgi:SEC-C motif-containing protein
MRSRYSACARGDDAYLRHSWHPSTRPQHVVLDPDLRWIVLEIVGRAAGGALAGEGTVEFRAHYERAGRPGVLHEVSRFTRADGRWVYLDAI